MSQDGGGLAAVRRAGVVVVTPGAATADDDWGLPPLHRHPRKHGLGHGHRIGVLWPRRSCPGFDVLDIAAHERLAREVERAGIDFVLVPDGYCEGGDAGIRSMLWAVPLILATDTIGVYTSMRTTFLHPTQTARFGAHLDWLSEGRWGWSVVTGSGHAAARLYGLDRCPTAADRYEMAAEAVDVVLTIWSSGDDGVEFDGDHFRVHGRVKRPQVIQQPRPPLLGSGASAAGRSFAADALDGWVTARVEEDQLRPAVDDVVRQRRSELPPLRLVQHLRLEADTGTARRLRVRDNGVDVVEHVVATRRSGLVHDALFELDKWSDATRAALSEAASELMASNEPERNELRHRSW